MSFDMGWVQGGFGNGWNDEYNCSQNMVSDLAIDEDQTQDDIMALPLALMPKHATRKATCKHHFDGRDGKIRKVTFYLYDADEFGAPAREERIAWLNRFNS